MFLPVVISTAWLPRLVRGVRATAGERLRRTARAPIELVLVLSLPIAAGTAIAARPLIDLLYGSAYGEFGRRSWSCSASASRRCT